MCAFVRIGGVVAAAVALAAFEPSAIAQENTIAWTCQENGPVQLEPLGDREGHSILVEEPSCRAETGPLAGGVQTSVLLWEWDGPNAVMLSGSGVIRKPGATVVWKGTEAKVALTMTDGKVTGWTVSGRGAYVLATGSWASMAGKSFTWTGKPVGPASQFSLEAKSE